MGKCLERIVGAGLGIGLLAATGFVNPFAYAAAAYLGSELPYVFKAAETK